MTILFIILIVLASVVLGFIVLVQNPKGGGLAGNVAGFSNQFMGVKQTTDVLEKGTWIFAGVMLHYACFLYFSFPIQKVQELTGLKMLREHRFRQTANLLTNQVL